MARKANDLLDVFRLGSAEGGGASRTRRPKQSPSRSRGGSGEGLLLTPRQMVLGTSVLVLLLVLVFIAGLGFGGRRRAGPSVQLSHTVQQWYVLGTFGRLSRISGKPVDVQAMRADLAAMGLDRRHVRIEEKGADLREIYIGPFPSPESAEEWRRALETARPAGETPFRFGDVVSEAP